MKIAICDDLSQERKKIREYLARYERAYNFEYIPYEYESAEALIIALAKESVDLVFFDIYMEGMSGIDAAKELKQNGFTGYIIFITTSSDHAVQSYKIAADDYLVKPFTYEEFNESFNRITSKWQKSFKNIIVKSERLELPIFLKDIDYIQSGNHCSYIHVKGELIRTSKLISQFEKELSIDECFLRCHQSYIVNLNKIKKFDNEYIYLKNGEKLLISVRDKQKVRQSIANYYWSQTREMRNTHE